MSALCAMIPIMRPSAALEIDYNHTVTPYHVEGWATAPRMLLSPIGNPRTLMYTFVPHNMPSANEQSERVDTHFTEEIAAGRMVGPYTIQQAHELFRGHFRTAPIGFILRPPGSGRAVKNKFCMQTTV